MKVRTSAISDVLVVETDRFPDDRGYFMELWNQSRYEGSGVPGVFVQDNVSFSRKDVLRGLHFQNPHPQGKLVTVIEGAIFDVAVDIRRDSPTFGQWAAEELSSENGLQMYVPVGFAHGFLTLSERALVSYKCTTVYKPEADAGIRWDDPEIGIEWPSDEPILSEKDAGAPYLKDLTPDTLSFDAGITRQ